MSHPTHALPRLDPAQAALMVIDIQGKLAQSVVDADSLHREAARMIEGARLFDLPVFWLEQLPHKLGTTHPHVAAALHGLTPIAKQCFSAWGEPALRHALEASQRRQILLIGMETHVCVWQTALDLLDNGYRVWTINDAISSRRADNRALGLARLAQAGALPSSVEMALFELQGQADDSPRFRRMIELVR
ncbi:MAG: hydrolase [Gammaproteobacteria bacterium]|nr:hydrolase [Gammaproteobacteria bacterium]